MRAVRCSASPRLGSLSRMLRYPRSGEGLSSVGGDHVEVVAGRYGPLGVVKVLQVGRIDWAVPGISLARLTTRVLACEELLGCFDLFGDLMEVNHPGQPDDREDQGALARVAPTRGYRARTPLKSGQRMDPRMNAGRSEGLRPPSMTVGRHHSRE
ncbi:MAG: hypothetical protein NVS3B21_10620 [Acidimicrobiales bacterium]